MPTIDEIRAHARDHAKQLEAVRYLTVQDLAARWGVDDDTVRAVPAKALPYLSFGRSRMRRYDPRDVERFEQAEKESAA